MNNFSAIIPIAQMQAANAALEAQGFGPNNFSVPAYDNKAATHAALHAWNDPVFKAAVAAIANVEIAEGSNPIITTQLVIDDAGAQWGATAPTWPDGGPVVAGELYQLDGTLWGVIQSFNTTTFPNHPSTYPALVRRVRNPQVVEAWQQPIDQYDSYLLVNAFTGLPDECLHEGKQWKTLVNNNGWEPGAVGSESLWAEVAPT